MSDFDYWPSSALDVLVAAIHEHETPPPASDERFWSRVLKDCQEADNDDEVTMTAQELARDVHAEFVQAKFVYPLKDNSDVVVGDLTCAESRLVSAVKGIKGVIFLASHPMEPLWDCDGIAYHTVVLSPAIEPSKTLSSQLVGACRFLHTHRPALVCSSSLTLPSLVVAAYEHSQSNGRVPIRDSLASAQAALDLSASDVGYADLVELDLFASNLSPSANPTEAALSTPRGATTKTGSSVTPLLSSISCDSSVTQIDAELLEAETPTKKATAGAAKVGKRERELAADEVLLNSSSTSGQKRAARHATAVTDKMLSRGTCATCEQQNVLGWPKTAAGGLSAARFECCACHDSNDEDEY